MSNYNSLKNKVLFKKYKVKQVLGKGSFGCVFRGVNIIDKSDIAIKVEKRDSKTQLLELESHYLSTLKGYGFPQIKSFGISGKFYVLIEELLGDNLHQIKKKIKSFTIKDILMIAIQIMYRIEFMHSKYIIHRDIKPDNFTVGYKNQSIIYIIDFGISKKYRSSRTGKHLKFSFTGKMFGTVRYVSYNGCRGIEQSRRDDLESIGYMLISLFKGKLPWQGLGFKEKGLKQKYLQMLYLKKNITPEQLCSGLPPEFAQYMQYCKKLSFEQDPDYEYLRNLFKSALSRMNEINDMKFSWINDKNILVKNNSKMELMSLSKEKYINLLKRKESPQIRLYKALKQKKNEQLKKQDASYELSCEQKNILINNKRKEKENRDISVDAIRNRLDNSNISREVLSYSSIFVHYNYNVIQFEENKTINELFNTRRNNLKNKITIYSPDKYYNNSYSQYDLIKSCDYKNTNKNKSINTKNIKKFNISIDLDKNFLGESNLINEKSSKSETKITFNNKNIKLNSKEKKRKDYCKKIYMNIINKINNQINSFRNVNKNNKPINNNISKNIKINSINPNKISKTSFNEESFSFQNCLINSNIKSNKMNNNNINNIRKNMPNNNNINSKRNIVNLANNKKRHIKINSNNITQRTNINNDNINYNFGNLLDSQNLSNDRGINIIINNNVNSIRNTPYNTIDVNNFQNYELSKNSLLNNKNTNIMKKNRTKRISRNQINSNSKHEIIENDYNSYQYIPKNNNQKDNLNFIKYDFKPIEKKYFYKNNINCCNANCSNERTTTETICTNSNYSNNTKNTVYKMNNVSNNLKNIELEYKSIFNNQEKFHVLKNNINGYDNLLKLNTYNKSGSSSKQSHLIKQKKSIKLNNNAYVSPKNNYNSIYYTNNNNNNNNWKINTKSPTKNNYNINNNYKNNKVIINNDNITHRNNNLRHNHFSNDINSYINQKKINNIKDNINILSNNKNIYIKTDRNIYHNYSPDIIKRNRYEYLLGARSADAKRKSSNDSTSMNKKGVNFNSNFIEEFNVYGHIHKNINNLNAKINNNITPKCFNNIQI